MSALKRLDEIAVAPCMLTEIAVAPCLLTFAFPFPSPLQLQR